MNPSDPDAEDLAKELYESWRTTDAIYMQDHKWRLLKDTRWPKLSEEEKNEWRKTAADGRNAAEFMFEKRREFYRYLPHRQRITN